LTTLRLSDLDGRVLTIERNLSLEVWGPTKSKRTRRMTIGATTAAMIRDRFDYRRAIHARASCSRTGSSGSVTVSGCETPRCTRSVTRWPPPSSRTAISSKHKPVSDTETPPRSFATTPTRRRWMTSTSPTSSTDERRVLLSRPVDEKRAPYPSIWRRWQAALRRRHPPTCVAELALGRS
jgi:hypothetical protein